MSYIPQPGTIPHKVIEHLKTCPPGTELSTAALADVVGQPKSSMAACLSAPRAHGALKAKKHSDGYMLWSLGDGTPMAKPDDFEPDEPLKPRAPFKPRQRHASAPAPEPEPDSNRAKYGVYSDGTFCVQRGQDAIWLTESETEELKRFLNRS